MRYISNNYWMYGVPVFIFVNYIIFQNRHPENSTTNYFQLQEISQIYISITANFTNSHTDTINVQKFLILVVC